MTAYASAMSAGRKTKRQDDFIAPARRALRRAARKARAENRRLGLPLITLKKRKSTKVPAFVRRAERAFRRAARNVRAESRSHGFAGHRVEEWQGGGETGVSSEDALPRSHDFQIRIFQYAGLVLDENAVPEICGLLQQCRIRVPFELHAGQLGDAGPYRKRLLLFNGP